MPPTRTALVLGLIVLTAALSSPGPVPRADAASADCLPRTSSTSTLPTTPIPPVFILDTIAGAFTMHLEIWRQSCVNGEGSTVLIKATPTSIEPFLCGGSFLVLQGGLEFSFVSFGAGFPFIGAFCGPLLSPVVIELAVDVAVDPATDLPVVFSSLLPFSFLFKGSGELPQQLYIPPATGPNLPVSLAAAVLPASRAVRVGGTPATAFATMIASGPGTAVGCRPTPITNVPATFTYQTTNSATNALTGSPNTPASIAGGTAQSYVLSFTPITAFPPADVQIGFDCDNTLVAAVIPGVNTILLSASDIPTPDIIALAATPSGDGVSNIPGPTGIGFFAVSTVNVGAGGGLITVSVDTGGIALPVTLTVCQTIPGNGQCVSGRLPSFAIVIGPGETPTFSVFATGTGTVPFDPAVNRANITFTKQDGGVVGKTSTALRTQ